jgi:predicted translin family RNA/ssDNA-binding protein
LDDYKKADSHLKKLKKEREIQERKNEQALRLISNHLKGLENLGGEILFLSKDSINHSIHDDIAKANVLLKNAERKLNRFYGKLELVRRAMGKFIADSRLRFGDLQGIYSRIQTLEKEFADAKEEYFEARMFATYLASGEIPHPGDLVFADFETYAGALSDLCGELLRKARLELTKHPMDSVQTERFHRDTLVIYQILSSFAFSNKSGIRAKMENLKGYIVRFEELLYETRQRTQGIVA